MVLPLVDEDMPKCYMCHEGFASIELLREHQKSRHAAISGEEEKGPAPGDVAVF